jgi:hypothetical protein
MVTAGGGPSGADASRCLQSTGLRLSYPLTIQKMSQRTVPNAAAANGQHSWCPGTALERQAGCGPERVGPRGVQGAAHLLPKAQHVDQASSRNDTVSAEGLGCGEWSGSTANSRWVGG